VPGKSSFRHHSFYYFLGLTLSIIGKSRAMKSISAPGVPNENKQSGFSRNNVDILSYGLACDEVKRFADQQYYHLWKNWRNLSADQIQLGKNRIVCISTSGTKNRKRLRGDKMTRRYKKTGKLKTHSSLQLPAPLSSPQEILT